MTAQRAITVKQLNMYVKSLLDSDGNLRGLPVKGEISNYTRNARSGHAYFTLKYADAAVKVVMFSSYVSALQFVPKDGMSVIVTGRITVYERDGQYQINAEHMFPDGIGAAYIQFALIKDKLEKEGLFDSEFKKPLPCVPKKIGVITSATGAALQDIISVSHRRMPELDIYVKPISVQGTDCPGDAVNAVNFFNSDLKVDLIIIARGGGSYEDLSGFNDEKLARVVFSSKTPVVSAVGHETDYTILDFVSDMRAPTPSAAAEIAVPKTDTLKARSKTAFSRCIRSSEKILSLSVTEFDRLKKRLNFGRYSFETTALYLQIISEIKSSTDKILSSYTSNLDKIMVRIQSLSPMATLLRGYSITYKQDNVVMSVDGVSKDDKLKIRLKDGEIYCVADKTEKL